MQAPAQVLVLQGTPYEIGCRKAEADGEYLAEVLTHYDRSRNERFDQWIAEKAIAYTEACWPELAEELQGYLDQSGYEQHAMYRYLFSQAKARFTCSNIAAFTEDVGYVFAKNTDLCHWEFPFIVFLHYKPEKGQEFFGYSYKGCLMAQGMNRAGLCFGGTSFSGVLEDESRMPEVGCPAQFVHRQNMQYARTVDEAVANLQATTTFDKPAGLIYLDARGRCVSVNHAITLFAVKENQALPAFCAGFFDMEKYRYAETFREHVHLNQARLAFARDYFQGKKTLLLRDVMDFLRAHGPSWSRPGQWCRHYPEEPTYRTCVSHICIPGSKRVLYCHGNPCNTPYSEFVFAD